MRIAYAKFLIAFVIIALAAVGIFCWRKGHEIHAVSRIKVEVLNRWANPTNFYDPQFFAIKQLLNGSECGLDLARAGGTDVKNFTFCKVDKVRGTKLLYLEYSGSDSNIVLAVASNAATLVVSLYETNFPSLKASYVDAWCR